MTDTVFNANELAESVTEPIQLLIDGTVYTVGKINDATLKRNAKDEDAILAADDAEEAGLLQRSIARLVNVDPVVFAETEVFTLRCASLFIMGDMERQMTCVSEAVKKRLLRSDSSAPISPDSSDSKT